MVSLDIRAEGIGGVVASLGRLADAAATAGGATLEVFSPEVYAWGVETGYTRRGRLARRAGGAYMFRQGTNEGLRGFDQELAAALPKGPAAVVPAYLSRGRRVVTAIQSHTPVISGRLRGGVTMRVVVGAPRGGR